MCIGMCCVGERVGVTTSVPEFGATDNDISAGAAAAATPLAAAAVSVISDLDDSLQHSCTLPPVDDEIQSIDTTGEFKTLPPRTCNIVSSKCLEWFGDV